MTTRIVFVADVHCGNHRRMGGGFERGLNVRARLCVDVLARARARAEELGAAAFVVLGDVFDDDRPGPQLVAAVQRALRTQSTMAVVVLAGNHDATSEAPGHTALAPLAPAVTVIADAPRVEEFAGVEIGLVPFRPGSAPEILRAVVPALKFSPLGVPRILATHFGVKSKATPPWLRDVPDAMHGDELGFLAAKHEIGDVFTGHWHYRETREAKDEARVWQVGSLCPTGFDDATEGHGLAVWEDGAVHFEEIEGPRFLEARCFEEIEAFASRFAAGKTSVFVSWLVPPPEVGASIERLAKFGGGWLAAFEVLPDEADTTKAAAEAAEAARSSTGLEDALSSFVAAMPLDEVIDRDDVLARASRYLERTKR